MYRIEVALCMMKLSRNSPCPCGSRKKYKNCCIASGVYTSDLNTAKVEPSVIDEQIVQSLSALAALQAFPENNSNFIGLQAIMMEFLTTGNLATTNLNYNRLHTFFFNRQWCKGIQWNKPDVFSTNVTSILGNTTILPGPMKGGGALLQALLNVIFLNQLNIFPKDFEEEAYAATFFILKVAATFAEANQLEPFDETFINFESVFVPEESLFETARNSCLINKAAVDTTFSAKSLRREVVDEFLLDTEILKKQGTGKDSPLLLRPFLDLGSRLLLLSPVNLLSALYFYLWRCAIKNNCVAEVSRLYHEEAAMITKNMVFHLDWIRPAIDPVKKPDTFVFQMDTDKLAFVLYVPDPVNAETYNIADPVRRLAPSDIGMTVESRIRAINLALDESDFKSFKRLFVAVVGNTGREAMIKLDQPEHPFLMFAYQDWLTICRGRDDYHSLTLWCFHHAKERFLTDFDTPAMSVVDLFALYLEHSESFYLSNEAFDRYDSDPALTPQLLVTAERRSATMVLPYQGGSKPPVVFVPVLLLDRYDEIYMADPVNGLYDEFAIKDYPQTIWFKPFDGKLLQTYPDTGRSFFTELVKMVAYWFKQAKIVLYPYLERLPFEVIDVLINVKDPERFFSPVVERGLFAEGHRPMEARIISKGILLEFNSAFAELTEVPDNRAERFFLETLLTVLDHVFLQVNPRKVLGRSQISRVIDEVAPLGRKKKLTIFNSVKDVRQLGDRLGRVKYLRSYETNRILDELVGSADPQMISGLAQITDKDKKLNFIGHLIFKVLIPRLRERLKPVDSEFLLARLIGHYEKLVYKKKIQEINVPTVRYCYPDLYAAYADEVHDNNSDINQAAIAYRCLIEFVAAEQHSGSSDISNELIDELLAIMVTIVDLGVIDDQLYFDLSEDHLAVLTSGRIGFQRHFLEDYVHPYQRRQMDHMLTSFHEDFDGFFLNPATEKPGHNDLEVIATINRAYQEAHGFTFNQVINFLIDISYAGLDQPNAYAWLFQADLIRLAKEKQNDLNDSQVQAILELFSTHNRGNALKPPKGVDNYEASPWRFNRLLSYLSKPFIVVRNDLDPANPKVYFGIRHLVDVAEQVQVRIMEGRLRDPKLSSFIGTMLERKGKIFNTVLTEWFKSNSPFIVFPELDLPGPLGDIDVLAIDQAAARLYLVEAKNTTPSKVAKEMAEERDRFLVADGNDLSWMEKHHRRFQVINADISILNIRTNLDLSGYKIIPVFITAQDLLIPYLLQSKKFTPNFNMPIFSFDYLKENGTVFFTDLKYDFQP